MKSEKTCNTCLNSHTPICTACHRTEYQERPGTPSHWVGEECVRVDALSLDDIAAILISRGRSRRPIPIHFVTKYNEFVTEVKDNEQKK